MNRPIVAKLYARGRTSLLFFALALAAGCDAGKSAYDKAAGVDVPGHEAEAVALYDEVCKGAPASNYCPPAKRLAAERRLALGFVALDASRFAEAASLFDAAAGDPSLAPAAQLASASPDLVRGRAFEAALAQGDHQAALVTMTDIADAQVSSSPKSREWLGREGRALMIASARAACAPGGQGSCFDVGRRVVERFPGSPEATEADTLMRTDRERFAPALKKAEGFLVQRRAIVERDGRLALCAEENRLNDNPAAECQEREAAANNEKLPSVDFLRGAWEKNLASVTDPGLVARLEARWKHLSDVGFDDPDPLLGSPPKPKN